MKLPLWTATGLSDYQIDFIKEYTVSGKKTKTLRDHAKTLFWLALYGGVGAGLWYGHLHPEDTPEGVANLTTFGVWVVMLVAFSVSLLMLGFVLLSIVTTIGFAGFKSVAEKEKARDDDGELISDQMSALSHGLCKTLMPHFKWTPMIFAGSLVTDAVMLLFFSGLIVNGWMFFSVLYFLIQALSLYTNRMMRRLMISHVKTLTPERTRELERLERKRDQENGQGPVIEAHIVDVSFDEDGEPQAEHTETVRINPDQLRTDT